MLSKFLQPCAKLLCVRMPKQQIIRKAQLIPPNQYDMDIPQKFRISHALRVYWELIPLFFVTGLALTALFCSIISACWHKVDVVFTTNSRKNISRTMNLRYPDVHKLVVINQRYEPWPEMQDVLDKMKDQETKLRLKMEMCAAKAKAAADAEK